MKSKIIGILLVEDIYNYRDIAITNAISSKQVYRSSRLSDYLNTQLLDKMKERDKIKTVLDLRRPGEADNFATYRQKLSDLNILWINYPFGDHGDIGVANRDFEFATSQDNQFYEWLPKYGPYMFKDILRILNSNQWPIVIHCSAGRDRTGMIVAILQLLVGVEENEIIQSYLQSEGAKQRDLEIFFKTLHSLGGIEEVLLNNGISREEIQQIREKLSGSN